MTESQDLAQWLAPQLLWLHITLVQQCLWHSRQIWSKINSWKISTMKPMSQTMSLLSKRSHFFVDRRRTDSRFSFSVQIHLIVFIPYEDHGSMKTNHGYVSLWFTGSLKWSITTLQHDSHQGASTTLTSDRALSVDSVVACWASSRVDLRPRSPSPPSRSSAKLSCRRVAPTCVEVSEPSVTVVTGR